MDNHFLKAGAAQTDITPVLGTVINGEFTCRYATKIADALFAKALVLQDSAVTIAIVIADTCALQRDFIDEVKAMIFTQTGIWPEHQLIAATHTHSGGSVADLLLGHVDWAYRKRAGHLIAQSVKEAQARLAPAQIGFGHIEQPQHLLCRRYRMSTDYVPSNPVTGGVDAVKTNPFGAEEFIEAGTSVPDPGLCYMAVKGMEGNWISILANYCLHYVGDCERGTISADYFGYFARTLAARLNTEGFVGIMSNGTSGEVNIWDFQHPGRYPVEPHKKSELIGSDLARALMASLDAVVWQEQPVLQVQFEELMLPARKPSAADIKKAAAIVAATNYETIAFGQEDFFERIYAREQLLLAAYPEEILFPVQSFKIGKGMIGALGGEFFSETGLLLKKRAGENYFTVCMANDYVGYVPPAHELEKGGYECWRCRTSFLDPGAELMIRSAMKRQIDFFKTV